MSDDYERYLHQQLHELRLSFERVSKPLIDELVRIQCMRPKTPFMLVTREQAEQLGLIKDTKGLL